jgi:hypothetical protein
VENCSVLKIMKRKITSAPVLVAILIGFALYGYAATPYDRNNAPILYFEWAISHGLIGLGIVLNLLAIRFLSSSSIRAKTSIAGRWGLFFLSAVFSNAAIFGVFMLLNMIDLGEDVGSLFGGDSGFAIIATGFWAAAWSLGLSIWFLISEKDRKTFGDAAKQ